MLCLLLSIIFYPAEKAKNNLQKFALIPLIAGLLFEGITIPFVFLSDTMISFGKIINVNIILSGLGVWEYYRLNISRKNAWQD
jgi:hypothetical protein